MKIIIIIYIISLIQMSFGLMQDESHIKQLFHNQAKWIVITTFLAMAIISPIILIIFIYQKLTNKR